MAVTIVPKPAFQECSIRVIEDYDSPVAEQEETVIPDGVYVEEVDATEAAAIVASGLIAGAIPVVPPTDWFEKPSLKKATPLTVTDDGRVFGHIAAWHVDHIGMSFGTKPPRSRSNYAYFHTGVVRTEEGTDVPVGQLTLAGGHAPLEADAFSAARHYDDTASAIADVHAGEDSYGIWVAGALRPGTTPEQVRALRASAPSGDWRPIQGKLELVAVCQVNVPGFPIARARVASGQVVALVAAGANVLARLKSDPVAELTARVNRMESERVANVAADARARFSALRAELDIQPVTAGVYEVNDNTYQKDKAGKLVEDLEQLLPNVFSFYMRTHGYHWNVKGQDFAQYHELFSDIYEDVFSSVDTIAENIRKLGSDAQFNLNQLAAERSIGDSNIQSADALSMSYDLYVVNERLIDQLKSVFRCADECDEQGVADFIAERINAHQKWRWQLRSSVTPENLQVLSERLETAEYGDEDRVYMSTFTALAASGAENFDQFDRATALSIIKSEVASRFRSTASELSVEEFKNFSPEERDELAKKGWALKDGSYPIRNVQDLKNAIKSYGRSPLKGRMDVRRHIIKRAKALDARDLIPKQWGNPKNSPSSYSVENGDADSGKASAAEFAEGIYTPKTQPRDLKGKFRQVLARIKENSGVSGIQTVLDKVQEAENYDSTGNYVAAAKAATDLLGIIDRIDTKALNPGSLENVRLSARELGKTIANLPLPFGKENEKVRYSDLPPALRSLIESMIDKVEQRIGQEDADEATVELRSFMSGGDYLNQSEISSQMSTLLRLLT
jgi:DNA-binding ferritin-like protein